MRIGIIGGTGREGTGLALRWKGAGHEVFIGSRDPDRGAARAAELGLEGGANLEACDSDVVVLAVPYSAHRATLESVKSALRGKILVDITVPLQPPKVRQVFLPEGQAAALEAAYIVGPDVQVVAALHHVSSGHLADPSHTIDCDVLVCGAKEAREVVIALIEDLGIRGLDAGPLRNAVALESLTPVLLHLNRRYGSSGTGLRITGLP